MSVLDIVLHSITIVLDLIGILVTFSFFILMYLRRSIIKTDPVTYLLAPNSYIAFMIASPFFLDMAAHSLYGQFNPPSSFDGWFCRFKSYTIYMTGCVYYHSFLLQSIFRFCRIVYPRRPAFQAFRLYAVLSVALWVLAVLLLVPSLILGDIDYLPNAYYCQFPPTSVRKTLLGLSLIFLIPFISTLICYFYTMYYVRTQTTALTSINQNQRIRRDFLVLSRLVLLFTFLTGVALPHVLIPVAHALGAYIPDWVVSFEWTLTVLSLTAACILQIWFTPHLRKLFVRTMRVRPTTKIETVIQNHHRA